MWLWGVLFITSIFFAAWLADYFVLGLDLLDPELDENYYSMTSLNFINLAFWLTLWPATALSIKRFHDVEFSGWWYVGAYGLTLLISELMSIRASIEPNSIFSSFYTASPMFDAKWIQQSVEALPNSVFWTLSIFNLLIMLGLFLITLVREGDFGSNKYGEDPLGDRPTHQRGDTLPPWSKSEQK